MFVLTTVVESVRVPPTSFSTPNYPLGAVHDEIDEKYPNRVIMDVGLVICRYGDVLEIGEGVCVADDGGAHYECVFRLLVFRPFVDEVCVGTVILSTEEGVRVSLGGFFDDVFVPAYWMLRPSRYDKSTGLWVWTPNYDDDDEDGEEGGGDGGGEGGPDGDGDGAVRVKLEEHAALDVEAEDDNADDHGQGENEGEEGAADDGEDDAQEEDGGEEGDRFEMELGAEIRFKVKALHFTRVTNTAKGVQATTTTTSTSTGSQQQQSGRPRSLSGGSAAGAADGADEMNKPVRQRSSSVDLSGAAGVPASFYIVASICEDGLGLTSWWDSSPEQDEEQEGEEEGYQDDGAEQGDPYVDEDYC